MCCLFEFAHLAASLWPPGYGSYRALAANHDFSWKDVGLTPHILNAEAWQSFDSSSL